MALNGYRIGTWQTKWIDGTVGTLMVWCRGGETEWTGGQFLPDAGGPAIPFEVEESDNSRANRPLVVKPIDS